MRRVKSNMGRLVMVVAVLFGVMPLLAADAGEGYALLIQQSPPNGGVVNPGSGIHRAGIGQTITLSAVPKAGYRFMYWLGDVANSSSVETTVSVDSPKMVVAVFSREGYEEPLPAIGITDGGGGRGGGGGGGYFNPMQSSGSASPTGGIPDDPDSPYYPPQEEPEDDFPVPEPMTLLLFGLGSMAGLKRR